MANTITLGNTKWATKKDSILAFNDENANFKPLPFTTSRASTATGVNKDGLLETVASGVPRVDYSGNSKGSYLLEPASTNLITYSEDFSQSSYALQDASVSSSTTTDPTGNQNSFKLIPDNGAGGNRSIGNNFTSLTNLHTISCFGKKAEYNYLMIRTRNGPTNSVMFDLDNGTFNVNASSAAFVSAKIEDYGNDWFRCSVTLDPSQMNTVGQLFVSLSVGVTGDETNSFSGDGVSGVYIFGAQFEEGSFATSYIPTSGSAQTRLSESASKDGLSSYISSTAGVLYAEIAYFTNVTSSSYKVISLNNGTSSGNTVLLGFTNTNNIYASVNGVFISSFNPSDSTTFFKVAIKYENNSSKLFINGSQVGSTNTSATVPIGLSRLGLDSGSGTSRFRGRLKGLKVYNTSLTDAELTTLTTI